MWVSVEDLNRIECYGGVKNTSISALLITQQPLPCHKILPIITELILGATRDRRIDVHKSVGNQSYMVAITLR